MSQKCYKNWPQQGFWLFLHCFKIRNISLTLECITDKYFTKLWPDWGCFKLIWGHLGLFRVIWTHLDWFKLIWGQLGTFGLPWLLVSLMKIVFHLNLFFYLNPSWVTLYTGKRTLSNIFLLFKRKRERGRSEVLCLLSAGRKTFASINDWAGEGCIQKTTKKCHEIKKISTLTSPKNSFKNAMKVAVFLL